VHVLQEDKILNKNMYLENNKALVYLPNLTEKAKKKIQLAKGKSFFYVEKAKQKEWEKNNR